MVPYRGGGPALADFLGGRVDISFVAYPLIREHIANGTVRALGVAGPRMVHDNAIPSLSELGLGSVDAMTEMGLVAPAQTPDFIVEKISKAASEAAQRDPLKQRLLQLGSSPIGSTPKDYAAHIQREMSKWSVIVERGNIKPE